MDRSVRELLAEREPNTTHWVVIGPVEAKLLLELNTKNRRLNQANVRTLAAQMSDDAWVDGVADIAISENGELVNGQHVLHAIVATDTVIVARLSFGLCPEAFYVYDTQRTRSAIEAADIAGLKVSNARAVRAFYAATLAMGGARGQIIRRGGNNQKFTNVEYVEWCRANGDWAAEMVSASRLLAQHYPWGLTGTEIAICHWILRDVDAKGAEAFLETIGSRERSGAGDPLDAMDRALHNLAPMGSAVFWRRVAVVLHTWNFWAKGQRSVSHFKVAHLDFDKQMPVPVPYTRGSKR